MSFKKVLYAGFLKIREIEGLPIQTKHRMLWEMLGMNGQNKDFWRVVGITELAYTKMLGGGESDTITFDAPEPGTYIFICSFPGHYQLMMGEFIVS